MRQVCDDETGRTAKRYGLFAGKGGLKPFRQPHAAFQPPIAAPTGAGVYHAAVFHEYESGRGGNLPLLRPALAVLVDGGEGQAVLPHIALNLGIAAGLHGDGQHRRAVLVELFHCGRGVTANAAPASPEIYHGHLVAAELLQIEGLASDGGEWRNLGRGRRLRFAPPVGNKG